MLRSSAVKYLFVRLAPDLRRRAATAAAQDGVEFTHFCRRRVDRWIADGKIALNPVDGEVGPWSQIRVPVSDVAWRTTRVAAIDGAVSVSVLVSRVIAHYTPHEVELLAAAIAREQTPSTQKREGGSDGS